MSQVIVDDRTGSRDLAQPLARKRLPVELGRLEFADIAFLGNGPGDRLVPVGIEVKRVRDVLACITDGRFAGHQLPGLVATYQVAYLLVEGHWYPHWQSGLLMTSRGRKQCELTVGARRFMYRDLDNWLTTMEAKGGMRLRRTGSRQETVQAVADLWNWWTQKDWGQHRAHLAIDETRPDGALLIKPNLLRRMAAQLPGIGWEKSQAAARHFKCVLFMALATEEDWMEVPGVGKTLAQRIVAAMKEGG